MHFLEFFWRNCGSHRHLILHLFCALNTRFVRSNIVLFFICILLFDVVSTFGCTPFRIQMVLRLLNVLKHVNSHVLRGVFYLLLTIFLFLRKTKSICWRRHSVRGAIVGLTLLRETFVIEVYFRSIALFLGRLLFDILLILI